MEERRYSSWLLERLAIGDAFRLRLGSNSIGRHHSSAIRILDSTYVSRTHAVIIVSDGDDKVTLQDLGSVNGIFVNGEHKGKETAVEIKAGDQVGIGAVNDDASPEDPVFILKHVPLRRPSNRNVVGPDSLFLSIESKSVVPKPTAAANSSATNSNAAANVIIISDDEDDYTNNNHEQNDVQNVVIISNVKIEKNPVDVLPSGYNKVTANSAIDAADAVDVINRTRDDQKEPPENSNVTASISSTTRISENLPAISNLSLKSSIAAATSSVEHPINSIQNPVKELTTGSNELPTSSYMTVPTLVTASDKKSCASTATIEKTTDLVTNQKIVQPTSSNFTGAITNTGTAHMPIISNLKKELVRTVSADIKSIFGDTDQDEIVMGTIKNINPYIYNEIGGVQTLVSGDCISVSSDDEECEKMGELIFTNDEQDNANLVKQTEQPALAKSPNIFETSLNTSNEEEQQKLKTNVDVSSVKATSSHTNIPEEEDYAYVPRSDDEDVEELMFSQVMISDTKAEQSRAKNNNSSKRTSLDNPNLSAVDEYNNDEIMFSQVIINDMKEELGDENIDEFVANLDQFVDQMHFSNSELDFYEEKNSDTKESIKKEIDGSCWIISDDENEDFDKELESKVSGWSAKLFSQSLTQGNMSQIYDIEDYSDDEDVQEDRTKDDDGGCDLTSYTMQDNEVQDLYISKKETNANKSPNKIVYYSSDSDDSAQTKDRVDMNLPKITGSSNLIDSPVFKKRSNKIKRVVSSSEEEEDVGVEKSVACSLNEKESKQIEKPQRRKSLVNNCNTENKIRSDHIKTKLIERRKSMSSNKKDNKTVENKSNTCNEVQRRNSIVRENSKEENTKLNLKKTPSVIDGSEAANGLKNKAEATKSSKEKPSSLVVHNEKRGPAIIDAPSLPKHKGKLRGVSANPPSTKERLSKITEIIRCENYAKDLKRKWLEKPSISKRREKEKAKVIKESRKERLKKIADNQQKNKPRTAEKRKTSQDESLFPEQHHKKPKVKVTTQNRGAFLTNETNLVPPKLFRIPKVAATAAVLSKDASVEPSTSTTNSTLSAEEIRKVSTDSFAQQLIQADIQVLKRQNSTDSTSSTNAKAAVIRSKRTTNKITFESMQRNFVESHENQKSLDIISYVRTSFSNTDKQIETPPPVGSTEIPAKLPEVPEKLPEVTVKPTEVPAKPTIAPDKPAETSARKKKKVRFNDTPLIHYIERVSSATKKVDMKELKPLSNISDRRQIQRAKYPIIDCTNQIISMILTWSNEWLIKRNAEAQAAGDVVMPMPYQFKTFDNYKSILFPLMKLEFLSVLEREYNTRKLKQFKVTLEYVTNSGDRMMLITKSIARSEPIKCDLVILDLNDKHSGTFAFASANRKGTGSCSTFVFEIIGKNFTKEYLNCIKEIDVRPVVDNIRVEFGAFNAVFQLESTPLFAKILDPLELVKSQSLPNVKFKYKGFDKLNGKQESILLDAYARILDETTPNITLIKGPPGTGKSCVITNLALQTLYGDEVRYMDKKILICAQSNGAVDVIASKLFDVQQRMRPEIMFRIIRYGIMDKVNKDVIPIMLQKIVERDQLRKLAARNSSIQKDNTDNLKSEMLKLEANILEMKSRNIEGTFEAEELIEKQKQLQMMHNIINHFMRPEDERSIYTWHLTNANIVCTTLSSCVKLSQYVNYFDVCIIDEATQCTEPWTLLPLKFGINSLVLVGDTQQLPATVLSKKAMQLGLGNSMFTRIQRCLENIHVKKGSPLPNVICSLQTQYRMHPEICRWPNLYFYKNELINAPITQQLKSPLAPFSILNLAYSQNAHCNDGKISNNLEAEFVVNLLKALDGYIPSKYNSYGVITPYAEHRIKLEESIKTSCISNVMVNTIDSYQGVEKDVIIISNARTHGIGFLANYQRLNVALTRPRKCLILCGNFKNVESVPSWQSLLNNARERKLFHEISATNALDIHRNVIPKIKIQT